MKSAILFLATFLLGAALALGARTVLHKPYAVAPGNTAPPPGTSAPAAQAHPVAPAVATTTAADAKPVNTVCAICGMEVDPEIKPAVYQGKLVGFGCAACPPRFAKEPDRYGPSALRNEVAPD
jgi:hypothetical protein